MLSGSFTARRRWPWRMLQAAVAAVLVVVMMGAGQSRFDRLGHEMICVCGCTQILLECNHVGCPDSDRMIGELREQVAGGGADTAILNWFSAKYGPTVLAAPIRGGFDTVAWIAPITVFVLATVGTAVLVWAWRKRTLRLAGPEAAVAGQPSALVGDDAELRERIRRETEYR